MDTLYITNNKQFLTYKSYYNNKDDVPCVIFHHGLLSDMDGKKPLYIEQYCKNLGYNYIRFNNFGHGKSSGEFIEQNITSWLEGLHFIIDHLTKGPVLLVGSSMGAWVSLLASIKNYSKRIIGLITIAAAADFSEQLIWNNMNQLQKQQLKMKKILHLSARDMNITCNNQDLDTHYPVSFNLIEDGRKHLLLDKEKINIEFPVHLIHGLQDLDVPQQFSKVLFKKITSEHSVLKLIKDGNHYLSRPKDLAMICNSITEIVSNC